MSEIVHRCPIGMESLTPCCGKSPFELTQPGSRITLDDSLVTCGKNITDHDELPVKKYDVRNCSHVWIGTSDRVYCVGDCGVSILAIANPTYGFCDPPPSTVEAVTKAIGAERSHQSELG